MRHFSAGSPFVALLLLTGTAAASGPARIDVAVVLSQELAPYRAAIESFKSESGMRVTELDLKGDITGGAWAVRQIRSMKPDVILSVGSLATQMVSGAVTDTPIVFCMTTEVPEVVTKSSNVTGISLAVSPRRQFQALQHVLPEVRTVGVVYDASRSSKLIAVAEVEARAAGLTLASRTVADAKGVPGAVRSLLGTAEVIWMIPDSTSFTRESFEFVLNLSVENTLPLMVFSEAYVRAGALLSLSPDYPSIGRQAARMVRRIHAGEPVRSIPIEDPEQPKLVINRRVALSLKTAISPQALDAPTQVVEKDR